MVLSDFSRHGEVLLHHDSPSHASLSPLLSQMDITCSLSPANAPIPPSLPLVFLLIPHASQNPRSRYMNVLLYYFSQSLKTLSHPLLFSILSDCTFGRVQHIACMCDGLYHLHLCKQTLATTSIMELINDTFLRTYPCL